MLVLYIQTADAAMRLLDDALALQDAGCFSIVIECVPEHVGHFVTSQLRVPTIGIGAGRHTAGQVLVLHDVFSMFDGFRPKFVKQYDDLGARIRAGLHAYHADVTERVFPGKEHVYGMSEREEAALRDLCAHRMHDGSMHARTEAYAQTQTRAYTAASTRHAQYFHGE
jgi:3-methyl-2-oxobutanoate hydroxymethyltransferase